MFALEVEHPLPCSLQFNTQLAVAAFDCSRGRIIALKIAKRTRVGYIQPNDYDKHKINTIYAALAQRIVADAMLVPVRVMVHVTRVHAGSSQMGVWWWNCMLEVTTNFKIISVWRYRMTDCTHQNRTEREMSSVWCGSPDKEDKQTL